MIRHRYAVHGLTVASGFRVHCWDAAKAADSSDSAASDPLALILATAGISQTDSPPKANERTRRGGLAVTRVANGLRLRTVSGDLAWLPQSAAPAESVPEASLQRAHGVSRGQFERTLCNVLLPNILAINGHRMLHAAAANIGGRAVLFCGESGAGKSTLAAGLSASGIDVLSDDVLRIAPGADGLWCAFPSYPGLHLRPETFLELPEGAAARRGKQWLPLAINASIRGGIPIAAMYALGRQSLTAPTMSPLGGVAAVEQWIRSMFMDGVSPGRRAPEAFAAASSLARCIPTWRLNYRRSPRHFGELLERIIEHAENR